MCVCVYAWVFVGVCVCVRMHGCLWVCACVHNDGGRLFVWLPEGGSRFYPVGLSQTQCAARFPANASPAMRHVGGGAFVCVCDGSEAGAPVEHTHTPTDTHTDRHRE